MDKWGPGKCKPFINHKTGEEEEADRFVAKQPYVFTDDDAKKTVFNLRKLSELPYHLIKVILSVMFLVLCIVVDILQC